MKNTITIINLILNLILKLSGIYLIMIGINKKCLCIALGIWLIFGKINLKVTPKES